MLLAEKVIAPVRGRTMMPPGLERLESVLESAEAAVVPHIMSEQEIMHKYRKISTSVRIASRLFTSSLRLSNKILFTFKTLLYKDFDRLSYSLTIIMKRLKNSSSVESSVQRGRGGRRGQGRSQYFTTIHTIYTLFGKTKEGCAPPTSS